MKKQPLHIAVLVSGIDEEYQNSIIRGIQHYADEHNMHIFHFIAFGGIHGNQKHDVGEFNIFKLANLHLMDGVIVLSNTINSDIVVDEIIQQIRKAGIPAVSIDNAFDGLYSICINNEIAMAEMVRHFVVDHKLTRINYISGPPENPDSLERLNAYKSVLTEHNIPIESERIYYGSFRGKAGRDAVEKFCRSTLPFPEAIICANDAMAISVLIALDNHHYRVPEDVMVSGFDNTYNARNYSPELTSVDRPLFQAGELACSLIYQHLAGNPQAKTHRLEMSPRYTESCGCPNHYCDDITQFKKRNYQILESNNMDVSLINRMACSLVECDSFEEYINALRRFILETGCSEFYLCLCSDWNQKISGENSYDGNPHLDQLFTVEGYTPEMQVPIAYYNGKFHDLDSFQSVLMIPTMLQEMDNKRSLYFIPLHFRERCLGYFAIGNTNFPLRSYLFHSWSMNISNSLENIRKILCLDAIVKELDQLYAIDPLTGIYNRNGFKRETERLYRYCIESRRPVMVMFIDMDGLKSINDLYGHKSGDMAIRSTAAVLNKCCVNREICCRFGGDEFIIVAIDYTEEDVRKLLSKIDQELALFNEGTSRPFTLSISTGHYITVPERGMDLFNLITLADKIMYDSKRKKSCSKYLKKN